ncbi:MULTISPECIES: AraC family transcriptional regulator [unclassified Paenibacillus]|uniref:helix-turn-helix transcriptional regulator n=1 Tax=unclassified Paenibacillus TaxID=185978 RepID=UPI00240640DB|nr:MULTISPECIES: AraC family transcriptional regulator [unclassified Paenibacillus]MDF9841536.1 AraC-like DNA-binding protein [Paenibacillus sp. PastF-2]MDF9848125.1 AraC-like DNA-binding protein [Paenibacillus sp. PastM-2]MDF9854694.1 AraC-like DNA-binding protein [Paenibacillus sp. PastF-1]MDH6479698.1 AraC-like DNA-binding protein [Paenibacillus sp. PastH-2]MDH6507399.1 AraC-like DNA-binding protein [Paenibacillus sp. PastM-3]
MEQFIYKKSDDVLALSASMSDFTYKKHCHEEYAVGVTLRGIQQYQLSGSFQSSHRGGVMLFNREEYHDGSSYDRDGIDYIMLYLRPELVSEALGGRELRFDAPIVYDRGLARQICALSGAVQSGREDALSGELLLSLIERLARTADDTAASRTGTDNRFIDRAKERMLGSLGDVLKLDELCLEFGMSKFQFIRGFKQHAGISPYQFFLNCKIEHARRSIERTKDIYAAVAEYGFFDLTHLNRHFKSMFGITAYEYMSQLN